MIKAILTDIEGTTSSISFVKDILFPYEEKNLPTFIRVNRQKNSVRKELNEVAKLSNIPSHNVEALITKLIEWIKADKKTTPLKSLQGMIWKKGYKNADYKAHIYNDAIPDLPNIINDESPPQESMVDKYFANLNNTSLGISPNYLSTYNTAKANIANTLNMTQNTSQYGYGNTFNDNYARSMTSANPFYDELTTQGLI